MNFFSCVFQVLMSYKNTHISENISYPFFRRLVPEQPILHIPDTHLVDKTTVHGCKESLGVNPNQLYFNTS